MAVFSIFHTLATFNVLFQAVVKLLSWPISMVNQYKVETEQETHFS